ncbi:hypothetical protein BU15DRAFT_76194 [Melanogaster broomeanus]|nr:hypothetical protein BU15DRAFT_76194 [Melanogaster broomeanus]
MLWFAWRASVSIDASGGDPQKEMLHCGFVGQIYVETMRSFVWATAQETYQRTDGNLSSASQGSQDKADSGSVLTALWNAWDLLVNVRGVGWNWSRGLIVPKPVFERRSRTGFVLWSAVHFAFHILAFQATLQVVRILSPEDFSSVTGGSVYDPSLPPVLQLFRCVTISYLVVLTIYFGMEWYYHLLAMLCVTVFQQYPSQWPPPLDSPWLSTSLKDFWGRRWHQMFRHTFLMVGGRPFNFLFGRLGGVIGVFLVSGIWHDLELRSVGRGNFVVVVGFFTMNGVGVVLRARLEEGQREICGGIWGWMWTFTWMTLWGVPIVDEWVKAGRIAAISEIIPAVLKQSLVLVSFVRRYI